MYPIDDYAHSILDENHKLKNQLTIIYNNHTLLQNEIKNVIDDLRGTWLSPEGTEELISRLRKILVERKINVVP